MNKIKTGITGLLLSLGGLSTSLADGSSPAPQTGVTGSKLVVAILLIALILAIILKMVNKNKKN